jgi:sulfur relay (sulfurtransferase) DsrF/TusC family protein
MAEKKVVVSFNRAPYGTIFYTEGLRAAVGTTAGIDEHKVDCVFLGEGVYFTEKNVDRTDSAKYITTLASLGTKLYAEEESLFQRGLKKEDLADDIVIIPRSKVLELYSNADVNIDF